MNKTEQNEKIKKWAIIKKTDNHNYFDCGLYRKITDGSEYPEISTSWIAIIDRLVPNTYSRFGGMMPNRVFLDCRTFKDIDEDAKYPNTTNLMVGSIIEIGEKTTFDHFSHKPPEKVYRYYKIIEITEEYVKAEKMTKQQMKESFSNPDIALIKQRMIEDIKQRETPEELLNWTLNLSTRLEHELKKVLRDNKEV